MVRVRCECGTEYALQSTGLTSGNSTRCRECVAEESYRAVQKGQRFDRLVVMGYQTDTDDQGRPRSLVECRCDCGGRVLIRSRMLLRNKTNNCGCSHRGRWTGVGSISTTFFNRQRRRAEDKGLEFTVTHEELMALYEAQGRKCALSGLPIGFSVRTAGSNTASLDRIDSRKGYVLGNVQWLHQAVNIMKLDHTVDEFVALCRAVVGHTSAR